MSEDKEKLHKKFAVDCFNGTWDLLDNTDRTPEDNTKMISINPKIPRTWNKVIFTFLWKGILLRFELTHDKVTIFVEHSKKKYIKVRVFNAVRELERNKKHSFKRKEKQVFGFYY